MRPQGLLVDYGGVLTTSETESLAAFCLETGVDLGCLTTLIGRAYRLGRTGGMVAKLEVGRITKQEFERWLAEELSQGRPRPLEPAGLTARLFSRVRLDDHMLDAVQAARLAGIRTGLVSNSWGTGDEQRRHADLFDAILVSREVGQRKPERGIYLLAAERLGVTPKSCVFVDDILPNVLGARAAGMVALLHRTADLTIPRLEAAFGVPLR